MRAGLWPAAALAVVALSGVAQASIVTETFHGVITSGIDNMGAFGAVDANLSGAAVVFSFSYDTLLLDADVEANTDGSYVALDPSNYEAYVDYAGDSAVTESVTINSETLTISNSPINAGYGIVQGCTAAECGGGGGLISSEAENSGGVYIEPFVYIAQTYSTADDLLSQSAVDALVGGGVTNSVIYTGNGANEDTLNIGGLPGESATPEPANWISLALGLGAVGLLLRRSRPPALY